MTDEKYFYTNSINLVAWLLAHDYTIEKQYKFNNKVLFYFLRDENLKNTIEDYNENLVLKKFIGAYKTIKASL